MAATKIAAHARGPSKESVSSYVTQVNNSSMRQQPNSNNQSINLSVNSQSAAKAHAYSGSGKLMINSTGVSSANVKTGSKQVN